MIVETDVRAYLEDFSNIGSRRSDILVFASLHFCGVGNDRNCLLEYEV